MTQSVHHVDTNQIDLLEHQLSELACRFRSEPESRDAIVEQYAESLKQLFQFDEWCGEPDIDSQLPDKFMPDVYLKFWDQKIGTIESILRSELNRARNVQPKRSSDGFQSTLASVIYAAKFRLALPLFFDDRVSLMCEVLGPIAIILHFELKGDGVAQLIWRVCRRILWTGQIDLGDDGREEFIEKLEIPGISNDDLSLTLARHCSMFNDVDPDLLAQQLGSSKLGHDSQGH